jgi:hypothetical protein
MIFNHIGLYLKIFGNKQKKLVFGNIRTSTFRPYGFCFFTNLEK